MSVEPKKTLLDLVRDQSRHFRGNRPPDIRHDDPGSRSGEIRVRIHLSQQVLVHVKLFSEKLHGVAVCEPVKLRHLGIIGWDFAGERPCDIVFLDHVLHQGRRRVGLLEGRPDQFVRDPIDFQPHHFFDSRDSLSNIVAVVAVDHSRRGMGPIQQHLQLDDHRALFARPGNDRASRPVRRSDEFVGGRSRLRSRLLFNERADRI